MSSPLFLPAGDVDDLTDVQAATAWLAGQGRTAYGIVYITGGLVVLFFEGGDRCVARANANPAIADALIRASPEIASMQPPDSGGLAFWIYDSRRQLLADAIRTAQAIGDTVTRHRNRRAA